MSRGGFGGGGRNTGGKMNGQPLPFDVDPDLEQEINGYGADDITKDPAEDPRQALFPAYPGGVPRAPPVTSRERRLVNIHRQLIAQKHAGPFYTGPKGSLKAICGTKRSAAEFNPFEDQPTYGKKYERKEFRLPDLRKHKFAAPHLMPKELWSAIGYDPTKDGGYAEGAPKKKLMISKKTGLDKLARFDEDADEGGAAGDDDEEAENKEEDADGPEEPEDDDFDEDEDDDNDDYNAEQYFDGGEEDYEEAGGDEAGGDDGW